MDRLVVSLAIAASFALGCSTSTPADLSRSKPGDAGAVDATTEDAADEDAAAQDGGDQDANADAASDAQSSVDASDGGSACDSACSRLAACTGLSCSTVGVDCASVPTLPSCFAACVDPSVACNDITTCLAGCASADGGADSGPSAASCDSCSISSCGTSLLACASDADCQQWLLCIGACSTSTCAIACDNAAPSTLAVRLLMHAVDACQCSSCATACGLVDPCSR